MTMTESEVLFAATVKAFKDKMNEVVSDVDMVATNGLALWNSLDKHYLQSDKSSLEVQGLRKAYYTIILMDTAETYDQFLVRFKNLMSDLEQAGQV